VLRRRHDRLTREQGATKPLVAIGHGTKLPITLQKLRRYGSSALLDRYFGSFQRTYSGRGPLATTAV
jgi:hypothetical protein